MVSQWISRHCGSFNQAHLSLYWASLILLMWFVSLAGALTLFNVQTQATWLLFGVFVRTFLHTGLFIVTHEAIHNNISGYPRLNDAFGYVTSCLYALLPYRLLAKNHRLHHRFPATKRDPDHHSREIKGFWAWYIKFMVTYQADGQVWVSLIGIGAIFCAFMTCHVSMANVMLFWIIPMVVSSLQLFTFGIFLPHRQGGNSSEYCHGIKSINLPVFWSFITCYHFGYHLEHHLHPHLPWYQLPQVYRSSKA
ncbi:fatty acid desaturase [Nodosilinea sp. LEGE 07088]|uniref:fatty acid desaturase n=1 Tax=Nodosilinea sp. LEGE 07088 TaxID=2777968 RepID=UPI00187E1523|nr:fatty acid desaturase [Nodosilinea sp. LEGE 07088]MBE9138973.1 fatty acid desaturase [Nodosilinea sp. LEGE 07088]